MKRSESLFMASVTAVLIGAVLVLGIEVRDAVKRSR